MQRHTFLSLIFFFIYSTIVPAQINGNGNKVTKTFPAENLRKLEINLSADITIDPAAKPGITITTDENVIDYINVKVEDGYLDLTQLEWIEPKGDHQVVIGAPLLQTLICDAHSDIDILNLDAERFRINANIGKITLSGAVEYFDVKVKLARINAEALDVKTADVEIKKWGKVNLGQVNALRSDINKSGSLTVKGEPLELSGDAKEAIARGERPVDPSIRWINFQLKNNSLRRSQFFVEGPKKDGSSFGYGFPMNPGQKRSERWTVGSKVYKVNAFGLRKLLLTIEATDEGEVVSLYGDK